MTTAAAIDRLIHHSEILELNAESYRIKTAKAKKQQNEEKQRPEDNIQEKITNGHWDDG